MRARSALVALLGMLAAGTLAAHGAGAGEPPPGDAEVADAYRRIPHRRTTYRAGDSTLAASAADRLERMFALVDTAVVLRVTALSALRAADTAVVEACESRLGVVEGELARLAPEKGGRDAVLDLVVEALREQRACLRSWSGSGPGGTRSAFDPSDAHVQAASRCLKQAYAELVRLHPGESPGNRQAFFDHLCALDFL